jgi:hypothetical protein
LNFPEESADLFFRSLLRLKHIAALSVNNRSQQGFRDTEASLFCNRVFLRQLVHFRCVTPAQFSLGFRIEMNLVARMTKPG